MKRGIKELLINVKRASSSEDALLSIRVKTESPLIRLFWPVLPQYLPLRPCGKD